MNPSNTDTTRYLCTAAYLNGNFRNSVIQQVFNEEYKAIAVSHSVDLPIVVKHCLVAKKRRFIRNLLLAILFVLALTTLSLQRQDNLSQSSQNSEDTLTQSSQSSQEDNFNWGIFIFPLAAFSIIIGDKWFIRYVRVAKDLSKANFKPFDLKLKHLKQRWAVRIQEVYQALLDFKPQFVHFSGHGSLDDGLVLEDETGNVRLVETVALASLFKLFASDIECVVLNACYSEVQASALAQHIPYVIGMKKAIGDKAAIKFATGFYNALAAGESVEFAYKLGCSVIQLDGIPEHLTPTLKTQKTKLGV